ncbi:MAG: hypothetical protein ACR2G3_05120 [Solirubrobacterales bacterium]
MLYQLSYVGASVSVVGADGRPGGADALHGGRARDRCQGGSSVDTAQECEIQHLIP